MYIYIRTYCLYFVYLIVRVDEIVVGAPTYSDGSDVNIGQIHIYINLTTVSLYYYPYDCIIKYSST